VPVIFIFTDWSLQPLLPDSGTDTRNDYPETRFCRIQLKTQFFIYFWHKLSNMPAGRPKKLNNYEQIKVRKIRKILSESNIRKFDKVNDSALLKTIYIDPSGKIFICHDFYENSMKEISAIVSGFIEK
jgi:hypothetical protein